MQFHSLATVLLGMTTKYANTTNTLGKYLAKIAIAWVYKNLHFTLLKL